MHDEAHLYFGMQMTIDIQVDPGRTTASHDDSVQSLSSAVSSLSTKDHPGPASGLCMQACVLVLCFILHHNPCVGAMLYLQPAF